MIYLDYAANTPCDGAVLDTYLDTERQFFGNPNASHPAGLAAREKMAAVTASAASLLGREPGEILWTSGASEANNLAVKGIARAQRHWGKHIISTPLEHPSVSGPLSYLQEQGFTVDLVSLDRRGRVELESLRALLREDTVLVAVCGVDSEVGTVQPLREIAALVRTAPHCLLHVDATQAVGKCPLPLGEADTMSLTAHKLYGPNGVGMLVKRRNVVLEPLLHGGSGASLYRSGTPTVALAAAFAQALALAQEHSAARTEAVRHWNARLRAALSAYPAVTIHSPAEAIPHILNLSVAGVKGTRFRDALSQRGVCVSVKSACATDGTPSRAVYALTGDRKKALSSWRVSLSHLTTEEEIDGFLSAFDDCYKELVP